MLLALPTRELGISFGGRCVLRLVVTPLSSADGACVHGKAV